MPTWRGGTAAAAATGTGPSGARGRCSTGCGERRFASSCASTGPTTRPAARPTSTGTGSPVCATACGSRPPASRLVAAPAELLRALATATPPRRGPARRRDPGRLARTTTSPASCPVVLERLLADPATLGYGVWVVVAPRSAHRRRVGGLHRAARRRHDRARVRHPRRPPRRRLRHRGGGGADALGPGPPRRPPRDRRMRRVEPGVDPGAREDRHAPGAHARGHHPLVVA